MPYNDGIPKINCYSLTDLHDFEECGFRFLVRHHLDRKYDIDEGNAQSALGNLLDQSMKKFHKANYYGRPAEDLVGLVRASARQMREDVEIAKSKGRPHFYGATIPFLTPELVDEAIEIFQNYYEEVGRKIRPAIEEVGFCEWIIKGDPSPDGAGQVFKLWGGPDTLEMGDDGVPEIVDYKSRKNLENGKANLDMDLMPKIYTLLCTSKILNKGFKKARFVVRFWQDPKDESFNREFNLEEMGKDEFLIRQKIERILAATEFKQCNKKFCAACKSPLKEEFLRELEKKGYRIITGEEFPTGG